MNLKKASLVAAVFYLLSFAFVAVTTPKSLYIKFIDVGQGDSIFIRTPEGATMLIDGGENYQADEVLNHEMFFPFCHLDYLVVTHPHEDHFGGLSKILKRCSIGHITFNDISYSSPSWDAFKMEIGKQFVTNSYAGDTFKLGNADIKILWPPRELQPSSLKNLNDYSTVVFLDYGDFEGLFLGDLQIDRQDDLDIDSIKSLVDGGLDVLKVAHHGSINGVYFPLVESLKARNCVVSVGSDNKFGHPDKGSMVKLEEVGCRVLRTDLMGDIVIKNN